MVKIIVDHTLLDSFTCPMNYNLRHRLGIVPKARRAALSYGGAWHSALSELYRIDTEPKVLLKQGLTPVSNQQRYNNAIKAFKENYEDREDDDVRTTQRFDTIFKAYAEKYLGNDPFKVIYNEHGFAVELGEITRAYPEKPEPIILSGRLDAIVLWGRDEMVYVLEHKTTTRMGKTYSNQFTPNLQMDCYYILCEALMGLCNGIYINAIFVGKSKTEFLRPLVSRSKRQIVAAKKNILRIANSIIRAEEWNSYHEDRNQCHEKWGCEYVELCQSLHDPRVLEMNYTRSKWNPLLGREEEWNGKP